MSLGRPLSPERACAQRDVPAVPSETATLVLSNYLRLALTLQGRQQEVSDGPSEEGTGAAAADLGMLGRAVGADRADPGGVRSAEAGAAEDRPAWCVRCHHLSAADGVPVEPSAVGVPGR